jgi:hypothetical protein
MPVVNLRVDNVNEALLRVGADEINAFEDETREAKLAGKIYEKLLAAELAAFPFSFTKKEVILGQITNFTPLIEFKYAYAMPTDAVVPVYKTKLPGMYYKLVGDRLYTNLDEVTIQYQGRPDESIWGPIFTLAFIYKMCQEFSVGLLNDESKAEKYEALYEKQIRRARLADSQAQPGDRPPQSTWYALTAVRG